jgi:uncharacterized membrane protein
MENQRNETKKFNKKDTACQLSPKVEQQDNPEKQLKQDFQVERLAFFSDAVFAIAITLLVIEFKTPHMTENSTVDDILQQLFDLKYHFFALLLSFGLIANYWTQHHRIFKYIRNYNTQIIVANMFVLLPIIFFPFTTTFVAESFSTIFKNAENATVYFLGINLFLLNNFLAMLTSYIFYWITIVKYKEMSYEMPKQEKIKITFKTLFGTFMCAAIFITILFSKNLFVFDLVILPLLLIIIILRKKIMKI